MDSSDNSKKNFLKHVFNFDDESKSEMLNLIQYFILALIPIILLNKTMQKYVPEADNKKSSLEILAEVLIQLLSIFIGLLLIHRMITFVPTYSGMEYPEFNVIYVVLAILMIILSLQTKLGEKVSILVDRIYDLWNGTTSEKKQNQQTNIKVSQPISGQISGMITTPNVPQINDTTSISSLPTINTSSQYQMSSQKLPDYNNMYRNDSNPLVNASTPGQYQESFMNSEPMAANSVLGGGAFGSW